MKFLILTLILLVSLSAFANYIPVDDVGTGNDITVFMRKNKCEEHYSKDCIKIPSKYDHNFYIIVDEEIDDLSRPVYSKNQVNNCGEYCQSLFSAGNQIDPCIDLQESLILNLELEEIYCSKLLRYEKKIKKVAVKDSQKESDYLALKEAVRVAEESKKDKIILLKNKLKANDLSLIEVNKVLKYLLKNLK